MADQSATVHASAVLAGARAVLIRGPAGVGKSALALALVHAARSGLIPFARLIGDDRVYLEALHGRLLVRPVAALEGLIEIRGLGIRHLPHEPVGVAGLVVDLAAAAASRFPEEADREAVISGVRLPRLAVASEPLPVVLAWLRTTGS